MITPNLTAKHANFISRAVALSQQINAIYTSWNGLREEWDSQDYITEIVDADFTGPNSHIVAADLQAFFVSQANMVTYWGSGNGTNITQLLP